MWAHLGAMLAYLGAMLDHLGAMLAHLGAMLAHLGAEKWEQQKKHCKTQEILMVGGLFWGHVGPSWGYVGLS